MDTSKVSGSYDVVPMISARPDTPLYGICVRVALLAEGNSLCLDLWEFKDISGFYHNDAYFTPADRVLENIVGSAYKYSWAFCNNGQAVVFRHHYYDPLSRRTYVSPDRRSKRAALTEKDQ